VEGRPVQPGKGLSQAPGRFIVQATPPRSAERRYSSERGGTCSDAGHAQRPLQEGKDALDALGPAACSTIGCPRLSEVACRCRPSLTGAGRLRTVLARHGSRGLF